MPKHEVVWRVVRLNRPIYGWHWWLQRGWWRDQVCWAGYTRKRFVIEYEEPHPTREAAEKSLAEWTRKSRP
jgi:hypothetical protein